MISLLLSNGCTVSLSLPRDNKEQVLQTRMLPEKAGAGVSEEKGRLTTGGYGRRAIPISTAIPTPDKNNRE